MNDLKVLGRRHFVLFLAAGLTHTILLIALFFRPSPFNEPYDLMVRGYFWPAVYLAWAFNAILSLFFVVPSLVFKKRWIYFVHAAVLFFSLGMAQLDHEILRFMSVHADLEYIETYLLDAGIRAPSVIWESVLTDTGGVFSSFYLGIFPVAFLVWAFAAHRLNYDCFDKIPRHAQISVLAAAFVTLVLLPVLMPRTLFGTVHEQYKISPQLMVLAQNIADLGKSTHDYSDILNDAADVKNTWQKTNADPAWILSDNPLSMHKKYKGICPAFDKKYNFVFISLETFRAWNMSLFNPEDKVNATPFIESLALSEKGAYYDRFMCNGQPTIFAFMSVHTGLLPHSRKTNAKHFTHLKMPGFPQYLRKHGYHTAFFAASDPEWDNEAFWARQWYDKVFFKPHYLEQDRIVMRDIADYIKKLPKDKPFAVTTYLISNHIPFVSPEPELDIFKSNDYVKRIYNTMRYDDEVLKEFFESVKNEDWFDDTVFIITGDHGYDLGERSESEGHTNSRHEGIWVPLIFYGSHPLIRHGRQDQVASQIDLAPTILHMAGICDDNIFFGHSLFGVHETQKFAPNIKDGFFAMETPRFSSFMRYGEQVILYDGADKTQKFEITDRFPDAAAAMLKKMQVLSRFADYYLEYYDTIGH